MVSLKPYLLRTLYEWCLDQGLTPYMTVAVDATTRVPREHVKNGQITFNITPTAIQHLSLGDEDVRFRARFSGVVFPVAVPIASVLSMYANENGIGIAFDGGLGGVVVLTPSGGGASPELPPSSPPASPTPPRPSHLKRVK